MKIRSRIPGLLLIAALATAPLAAGAGADAHHPSASPVGRLAAPGDRPAGCHAHGGKRPYVPPTHSSPPAPVSYQCCLTGHDVAVVQASHSSPPSDQGTGVALQIAPVLTECFFGRLQVSLILSSHPPGTPPLRI